LITRTPHGSSLTEAGTTVAAWADRLLVVAAELDAGLATLRHDRKTRLRISASLTIAEQLLPHWLVSMQLTGKQLGRDPAEVTLVATNSDQVIARVRSGEAELGFIEGPEVPRALRSRIIGHDRLVLITRPDHVWARRARAVTAQELADTPLVTREEGSGTREALTQALDRALGPRSVHTAPVMALSTTSAVRAAVLAGAGPAVLSFLGVVDDLTAGRLVAIDVLDVDLARNLRAIWIGARIPPAGAVRDLLSHIASITNQQKIETTTGSGSASVDSGDELQSETGQ
jgi:DNA-binding transcriptional LysR family regulator